jgi:hypothetical protein
MSKIEAEISLILSSDTINHVLRGNEKRIQKISRKKKLRTKCRKKKCEKDAYISRCRLIESKRMHLGVKRNR